MHDSVHDLSLSVSKFDTLFFQENSILASNECSHIRHLNVGCDGESLPEILTAVVPKLYSLFSEIDVFKKLSKSFTRLRVLKFVGAANICELPDSRGELKHLRYLDISRTSIEALPKSTTILYNLQTLRLLGLLRLTFPDGLEKLISLKHLYFDRKELSAKTKQEANGAYLHHKEKLCKVIFDFEGCDSRSSGYNSEEVMEGLQPRSNLQSLAIWDYGGESFPSWMLRSVGDSNTGLVLLNNLMELNFFDCINCESLPPLGQLHNLQYLKLGNLKRMVNEFYCKEGIDVERCNKLEVLPITEGCSSLEKLHISSCGKLSKTGDGLSTSTYLKELDLSGCPNLSSIPNLKGFSSLQYLSVQRCNKLKVLPRCSSLEKLRIFNCVKLSKIGDGLSTSTCLKELHLEDCPNLCSIPNLEGFSSLQNLSVQRCNELEVLPITEGCSSLEKLQISSCEKLSKIRDRLSTSTCLKQLHLEDYPNLSSIPNLEGFSSLQNLSVDGCDKLESFPLKAPLSSLKKLMISDCPNLKPIPSLDGLSSLTELEFEKVGEEWSSLLPNMLQSNVSLCSLTILNLPNLIWIQDDSLGSVKRWQHNNSMQVTKQHSNIQHTNVHGVIGL
ncbi:hypothetical protein Gotri_027393 [Gossypium trilobum]|uniref:Uncharacterized protein n=1 Tax=Gossypium trilobum TaxID=34281 RepID=A0A7J9FM23_9ROSI|nr:hypothetical protein [Gossypium trilobum]